MRALAFFVYLIGRRTWETDVWDVSSRVQRVPPFFRECLSSNGGGPTKPSSRCRRLVILSCLDSFVQGEINFETCFRARRERVGRHMSVNVFAQLSQSSGSKVERNTKRLQHPLKLSLEAEVLVIVQEEISV